jgi:hypothetical protein
MKDRNIFSSKNPPSSWTRNPNHFLKNFDLSGFAVYVDIGSSSEKTKKSAALISNKHVLLAKHVTGDNPPSFNIKFVNNSNEVFTYSVDACIHLDFSDMMIGVLDRVIDPSLCFYKVLRSNFDSYYNLIIDSIGSGSKLPVIFVDQDKNLSVGDAVFTKAALPVNAGNPTTYPLGYVWQINVSNNNLKYSYSEYVISGDSGNPIFCILNNELILLGLWHVAQLYPEGRVPTIKNNTVGKFAASHKYISDINSAMTALAGSSYSVIQIAPDFNTYSSLKIPSITIGSNTFSESVSSYSRSPNIRGYGQENKTISLDDDSYIYGPFSLSSDLSYLVNPSSPYLGLTTNNLKSKTNEGGTSSDLSSNITYKALTVPAPIINSISNTNNKKPIISGTWTQTELPTYSEDIYIDIYDNNVIISSFTDITLSNVNLNNTFTFSFTPSSDLSVGTHTIKAKAYYFDNNYSSFSNSVTFDVLDTGGS